MLDFNLNPIVYDPSHGVEVDRGFIFATTAIIDKYRMTIFWRLFGEKIKGYFDDS
ncbi:MAG: hypothetical protein R2827_09000 [Bdellovibrionales bacterium]